MMAGRLALGTVGAILWAAGVCGGGFLQKFAGKFAHSVE